MAHVSISINGRPYTVACEDGQEPRLNELAVALDAEVKGLAGAIGQVGDSRLLVISGLSLIDQLSDLRTELDDLRSHSPAGETPKGDDALVKRVSQAESRADAAEAKVAELEAQLAQATRRISSVAASLEDA